MKILIAPDKFKGSLTAVEVCNAVGEGIRTVLPISEIVKLPLADGGEGSIDALSSSIQFEKKKLTVNNPLFKKIEINYYVHENSAYIEMASSSGLQLLDPNDRNPMLTSSFGTGEIIFDAIKSGIKNINLFIGGSATNDAGIGIASALGFNFKDKNEELLLPIGKNLEKIYGIDNNCTISFANINFTVLTDVLNPLYGENGAAQVFASQKGAGKKDIEILENGLINFAKIVRSQFGIDISTIPGSGAAGGVGGGCLTFFNAKIKSGIEHILEILNFKEHIKNSDLVITGEGSLDSQTLEGKVVKGVIDKCKELKKPVAIVCGRSTLNKEEIKKINSPIKSIKTNWISEEESMKNAYSLLVEKSAELVNEFRQ